MNICIPVEKDDGVNSSVCSHFGSAPLFLIVNTDNGDCRSIVNANQHHGHGMCQPLQSLNGENIDAMIVGGIGMGALNKLNAAQIKVYLAEHEKVSDVIAAFKTNSLKPVQPAMACKHHHKHP